MTLSRSEEFDADKPSAQQPLPQQPLSEPSYYLSDTELATLETSVPLEAPRLRYVAVPAPPVQQPAPVQPVATPPVAMQPVAPPVAPAEVPSVQSTDVEVLQLLEERVVVNRLRRKVGDVIIRKEIETKLVQVPIRREKLIVEQVSPEARQLAVVDLGQTPETEFNAVEAGSLFPPTIEGKFASASDAIQFLQEIMARSKSDQHQVQISVATTDADLLAAYEQWLKKNSTNSTL